MDFRPIETKRLTVLPTKLAKLEGHHYLRDLIAIYGDPEVMEYLATPGNCVNVDYMRKLINSENDSWSNDNYGLLLVIDRTADKAVAVVKFQSSPLQPPRDWEVVCAVHPAHRREKYGLEAVRAAIAYEFTRGRGRIVGIVNRKNKGSRALVEALGFTKGEDRVLQLGNAPEIREHVYEVTPITLRP